MLSLIYPRFDMIGSYGVVLIIIIVIIVFPFASFFTPTLADSLSLESERQHVSSGLQGTSQYSGRF